MTSDGSTLQTTIPEECNEGNYMDLNGPNNQHRFIDYTVDYSFERLNSHDKTNEFDFKWFRFNLENETANRMLERNDVSDLIMKEKVCVVCLCSEFEQFVASTNRLFCKLLFYSSRVERAKDYCRAGWQEFFSHEILDMKKHPIIFSF